MRPQDGTPIEEAPLWALAIFAALLWLIVFPALVGMVNGFGLVRGGGTTLAVAAAAMVILLTFGLARQRRWRRPSAASLEDRRPVFVRFSTWLITALLIPNVLFGSLILFRAGEALDYRAAWLIGLMVSAIQGLATLRLRLSARLRKAD
jgi:hypothetical protein